MEKFDLAVIGAGPAGMIAAARAGELGARVVLLDKNEKPGQKLLLTGNKRCNLTKAEFDLSALTEKFGKGGKFLFPAFNLFGPRQTMQFFESRGLTLKVEDQNKVFPASGRAADVLNILLGYLRQSRVEILSGTEVIKIVAENGRIEKLITLSGEIAAKNILIATGGKSYPQTGSDGRGYQFLRELGHKITTLRPGLVPIKVKEKWVHKLQGLSVENVELSLLQNQKKLGTESGDLIFTHFGLSGPAALDLSAKVSESLSRAQTKISVNFAPGMTLPELEGKILAVFSASQNKMLKNCIDRLVPPRLALALIQLAGMNPDKRVNLVSKPERQKIAALLNRVELSVSGLLGFDQAMITTGGAELKEIDPSSMNSKLIQNLFLAGEILNLQAPSGGYNLQLCWSSGYLAGNSVGSIFKGPVAQILIGG